MLMLVLTSINKEILKVVITHKLLRRFRGHTRTWEALGSQHVLLGYSLPLCMSSVSQSLTFTCEIEKTGGPTHGQREDTHQG